MDVRISEELYTHFLQPGKGINRYNPMTAARPQGIAVMGVKRLQAGMAGVMADQSGPGLHSRKASEFSTNLP